MKKSFLFTLLIATSVATSAFSADIFDAMGNAYSNNPSLQASRAYLRSVDENVAIAKSGFRPNVSLQGAYSDTHTHHELVDMDTGYNESYTIQASQSVFSGFSTYNSIKAAKEGVKAEQSNLYNIEQQILLDASTAYLNVLRDKSIVELQKNNEKLLKKRLDETRERFNVGEVTRTDVSQAEARHSQAISDRIAAEGNLAASEAIYVQIIGSNPENLTEPEGLPALFPVNFEDALSYAKINNYGLKAAKSALESRKHTVNATTGGLLPNIDVVALNTRGQEYNPQTKDPETNTYRVEARMTVPLYNSGETRAKIRQSKYQKWQAHEQVLEAQRAMVSSVSSNWEYMISNKARIESVKDQIKAYEIALDGVQQEEALGNRTVLDVLDAYQSLLNSKVEEVRARRDYYVSGMQLLMSMGKLTAKDLKLAVNLYNAEKHSKETAGKWLSISVEK